MAFSRVVNGDGGKKAEREERGGSREKGGKQGERGFRRRRGDD